MQRILDTIIDLVLDSESMDAGLRARLRDKLVRAIAVSHKQINAELQTDLSHVATELEDLRNEIERLLYPVALDRKGNARE